MSGSSNSVVGVDARTEDVVQSDSSPVVGDSPMTTTNGKLTDDSEHFADVTPVHTKISEYSECVK